jgi:hypothetical protein
MITIYFIHKRQLALFIILLTIASCFHLSAVLWFFAYFIYHKKISGIAICFFLGLSLMMGLFGSRLYVPLLNAIAESLGASEKLLGHILVYLNGQYDDGSYSVLHNIFALAKRMVLIPVFFS